MIFIAFGIESTKGVSLENVKIEACEVSKRVVGALLRSVPTIVNEHFTDARNEDIDICFETCAIKVKVVALHQTRFPDQAESPLLPRLPFLPSRPAFRGIIDFATPSGGACPDQRVLTVAHR